VAYYSSGEAVSIEAPHEHPENKPPSSWPELGAIVFEDVTLSYRSGLPDVLKKINMSIKPGERIGIVGRHILTPGLCHLLLTFCLD